MSFVTTQPEALSAAAGSLQGIGSGVSAQNAAAAAPTTGVVPAGSRDVGTGRSLSRTLSCAQAVSAGRGDSRDVRNTLGTSAGSYAATEAANAATAAREGLVVDFGALPPEINLPACMRVPGSSSLQAAASA
jgi:hypothetical protein